MALKVRRDRKLTPEEKPFARRFNDACQARLDQLRSQAQASADEAGVLFHSPPQYLSIFRHPCTAHKGVSTAMQLKEVYWSSEDPWSPPSSVADKTWDGHIEESISFNSQHPDHLDDLGEPGGLRLLAWITREGACRACGQTALSPTGRLVLASERPPTAGRMARA